MKKIILILLFATYSILAQRPPDEYLANFSSATEINTALLRAQAALTGLGTANQIAYFTTPTNVASLPTTTYPSLVELSYIKGVTSSVQSQLNSKASTSHTHTISSITNLQTSLDAKQSTLVSGTNIKTINNQSLLGSGNITISIDTTGLYQKIGEEVSRQLSESYLINGTGATLDSMITDFRKNNSIRLNK